MKQIFSMIVLFTALSTTCVSQPSSTANQVTLAPKQFTDLPIDPATGKISFTEVISADLTPAGKIRSRIKDWQNVRNTETTKNFAKLTDTKNKEAYSKKDDRDGQPFLCVIYPTPLNDTSKMLINVKITNIKTNDMVRHPRYGEETATFTVLIKDNKYKVSVSDLVHITDYSPATVANPSGGVSIFNTHSSGGPASINYENAEFKKLAKGISQKEWLEIRQEGLNKMYKVLSEMVSYVAHKDDMNF